MPCSSTRSSLLVLVGLAWLFAGGTGCATTRVTDGSDPSPRPNVLLITVDTLRADRLGCYGHAAARTPTIDRLAEGGARFLDASTCIPRTTQSIASIFTGRYPHEHGVLELSMRLGDEARTLAELLHDAGYETAGLSANPVAGRKEGLDQGFETFVDRIDMNLRRFIRERGAQTESEGRAEELVNEALKWIDTLDGERPWLLWLLPFDPHWIYDPPPPYNQVIDRESFTFYDELRHLPRPSATTFFNLDGRSAEVLPDASRLYDAELTYVDAMLGRLLQAIELRAGDRETLVVLTADHGESLGEHGYFYEHGDFVYDATMRVPLIFHWPGRIPGGSTHERPVSTLDLLPTLLSLTGAGTTDRDLPGRDLGPLLLGGERTSAESFERILLGESGSAFLPQNPRRSIGGSLTGLKSTRHYIRRGRWVIERRDDSEALLLYDSVADPTMLDDLAAERPEVLAAMRPLLDTISPLEGRWRMARDERFKLIRAPESEGPRFELYDLLNDPAETRDIAAEEPTRVERLRGPLEAWIGSMDFEAASVVPARSEADEHLLTERLRALGYVD